MYYSGLCCIHEGHFLSSSTSDAESEMVRLVVVWRVCMCVSVGCVYCTVCAHGVNLLHIFLESLGNVFIVFSSDRE